MSPLRGFFIYRICVSTNMLSLRDFEKPRKSYRYVEQTYDIQLYELCQRDEFSILGATYS